VRRTPKMIMQDPRIDKLADVLVRYSVALKKNDLVLIQSPPVGEPLAAALYGAAIRAGAHPHVRMAPPELSELLLKHGSDEQLDFVSPLTMHDIEKIDAHIGVWADTNTRALTHIDPARQARLSAARKPIMKRFSERAATGQLHWTGTGFPTQASAQDAEMSLTEYEDFVFGAGMLHLDDPVSAWREVAQRQQQAVDLLNGQKTLRLEAANGTDLTMSLDGRKWVNCCGKENFPDGEIFTGPVEDSLNGWIVFSFPTVHHGRSCEGVRLRFEKGRVVEACADKGEEFLIKMLDQDDGARAAGEFAIGCNYHITQFTRNTLFDEKIGGTVHLAVGEGFPETGSKNTSGLHWDMVCDLRPGGRITADGQTIYENGKFTTIEL
jgi:aminopeptidase